jgi:hypothetical protein
VQISPIKSAIKPPLIEPNKVGLKASANLKVLGNSIQLVGTTSGTIPIMELRGETTVRSIAFSGGNTVDLLNGGTWPFSNGASLTFLGLGSAVSANNKTVAVTTVSGSRMAFPASTFTNGVSLNGTVTDGTTTVYITVSPDHPQTLTSLSSFDLFSCNKNLAINTATFPVTSELTLNYNNTTGEYTINGTSTAVRSLVFATGSPLYKFKSGQKVTVSIIKTDGTISAGEIRVHCQSGASNPTYVDGFTSASTTVTRTNTLTQDWSITGLRFYIPSGTTCANLKVKIQIEINDAVTDWVKPQSIRQTIDLKDTSSNPLENRGIPLTYNLDGSSSQFSWQDQLIKKADGKWYFRRNGEQETVSGGTSGYTDLGTTVRVQKTMSKLYNYVALNNTAVGASTYLKFLASFSSDTEHFYCGSAGGAGSATASIFINKTRLATQDIAGANAYLAANPLTFAQLTIAPVDIELHADNQTALNAIAQTLAGITNIMLSTGIGQIYVELSQWSDSAKR